MKANMVGLWMASPRTPKPIFAPKMGAVQSAVSTTGCDVGFRQMLIGRSFGRSWEPGPLVV